RRETPPADLPPPHLGLPIGTTLGFVWRGAGEDMRENPFGDEMPRRSPHRTKRLPQLIDDQRRTATDPSRLRDHGPERVVGSERLQMILADLLAAVHPRPPRLGGAATTCTGSSSVRGGMTRDRAHQQFLPVFGDSTSVRSVILRILHRPRAA